jgi:hypothetical protein
MSFYNPNIQSTFDADQCLFIKLENVTLATYTMSFKVSQGCYVDQLSNFHSAYQLQFLKFSEDFKLSNLNLIDKDFPNLFVEIVKLVFVGKINTFADYLRLKSSLQLSFENHTLTYLGDRIQDYLELLVYSDISENKQSRGERDFTKIFHLNQNESPELPQYFSLYERLKLYNWLREHIRLEVKNIEFVSVNQQLELLFLIKI